MKYIILLISIIFFKDASAGFRGSPFTITASESFGSPAYNAKARVTIDYANFDGKVRKPIIVFEGFDPGYYSDPDKKEGRKGIQEFLDDINDDGTVSNTLLQNLLQGDALSSLSQEYDLVWVDWENGTDFLQRNALVAEEVIRWVNTNKILVGGVMQPNVVMGKSMGSIIARMALRRMENNSQLHNTRLYVSIDGGHQGSNIPQGYQHMTNHFRDLYISTGTTAALIESIPHNRKMGSPLVGFVVNETPAAR